MLIILENKFFKFPSSPILFSWNNSTMLHYYLFALIMVILLISHIVFFPLIALIKPSLLGQRKLCASEWFESIDNVKWSLLHQLESNGQTVFFARIAGICIVNAQLLMNIFQDSKLQHSLIMIEAYIHTVFMNRNLGHLEESIWI